jgi:hypothetical protein
VLMESIMLHSGSTGSVRVGEVLVITPTVTILTCVWIRATRCWLYPACHQLTHIVPSSLRNTSWRFVQIA